MAITMLPTPPTRNDPTNFDDRADLFLPALLPFCTEANALAAQVNADAISAAANAATAILYATNAANAAASASSVANYKGEWSSLVGSLNIPASVSYNGVIYTLKEYVADVTAVTPGVSSVWLPTSTYIKYTTISTNTTAVVFGAYKVTANCNVTLPASPVDGQWVRFLNVSGVSNFSILRNGKTIMGLAQDLNVNVNNKSFIMVYQSSSNDWLIIV